MLSHVTLASATARSPPDSTSSYVRISAQRPRSNDDPGILAPSARAFPKSPLAHQGVRGGGGRFDRAVCFIPIGFRARPDLADPAIGATGDPAGGDFTVRGVRAVLAASLG